MDAGKGRFLDAKYTARAPEEGALVWRKEPGFLAAAEWICIDFLHTSPDQACFRLELQEGEGGPLFRLSFSALPGIEARLRFPLARLDLNAWALFREGALLKRCCNGDRVRPERIDRMRLVVERMAEEEPVSWEMGVPSASVAEPPLLKEPRMKGGPAVDMLGQCRSREWPGKTVSESEMTGRIRRQHAEAPAASLPAGRSSWGGWTELRFEPSGYFRSEKRDGRWWLVDPDGCAYWSAAPNCVRMGTPAEIGGIEGAIEDGGKLFEAFPECRGETRRNGARGVRFDFLRANLIRAFGREAYEVNWADTVVGLLKRMGFNGFGNWSKGEVASARGFPYVHPLDGGFTRTPTVFRDFPDVWHPGWPADVADYAAQLERFHGDRALIGYFLMNEPKWGFASQTPAEGMLLNAPPCPARRELAGFLKDRHGDDASLSRAWGVDVTFDSIAGGPVWTEIPGGAKDDLAAFSTRMAVKLFGDLSEACRRVDPDHLNLGVRYYILPPDWLAPAMECLDVFSMNCYAQHIPSSALGEFSKAVDLPVLIGEWHFGALDVGLPMAGICRVADQAGRGKAYRSYLEDAASYPWCVGAHYFQLFDQPWLGRFDGENWNIGIIDTCHRVYPEFAAAARASHEVLYEVASGRRKPFAGKVEHRTRHFC
jgi:hypothetical protein